MSPTFIISDYGTAKIVADKFEAGAAQSANMNRVYLRILLDMMRVSGINITSWGHRGGGSYARLKPGTVKKKGITTILRTEGANPGYDEIGGNALFKSVTEMGAEYQVINYLPNGFEFGTDRPWAFVHQYGSPRRGIPRRPFLRFIPSDQERWNGMLIRHLMKPFTK